MRVRYKSPLLLAAVFPALTRAAPPAQPAFAWPEGARVALSLSFDDARSSQVEGGTELLDRHGVKATFFVLPSGVEERLAGWKKAVASGHEIGNHSSTHPCTGNFAWSRSKALEEMTLPQLERDLREGNSRLQELLGVVPETFAYPCGQKFVGRGLDTRSYVPVVASLFLAGRGFKDEVANDPAFCDLAQITGIDVDGKDFEEVLPLVEAAREAKGWLVLAGHEMGEKGEQTTRLALLDRLIQYARDPAQGVWLAPVGTVARYVREHRAPP